MGRLKTRRTAHPKSFDTRSLLVLLLPRRKNSASKGLFIIKAMLGKTLQGQQEDMALECLLIMKATLGKTLQGKQEDRALATGRGRKLVGEAKNQKDCTS